VEEENKKALSKAKRGGAFYRKDLICSDFQGKCPALYGWLDLMVLEVFSNL